MSKLVVGCGYVGKRLARFWRAAGEQVYVTTRSQARAKEYAREGLLPIILDVTEQSQTELPPASTVVFAVGFDRSSGAKIQDVYVEGLKRVLHICDANARKFIYVSSTGVYGDTDGSLVDERTPCHPNRPGGEACLEAERLLQQDAAFGNKTIVLRMAGIYGPDRLPQLAKLKNGEPLLVADNAHLNLIHVDDIVRLIVACDNQVSPPTTFCVSDGQPVRRGEFYRYLAALVGCPPPVFEPPATGSSQAERARGDKRISNARLVAELGPTFLHPSYREGLQSIVR